jgi:hypothetical protein
MPTATRPRAQPRLSDEDLVAMLGLMKNSDSVELKMTVGPEHQRSAIEALGLDPLEAQIRMVYFFDTPDLALEKRGVVVRARRIAGKREDSVVKLRPVDPSSLPDDLRQNPSFVVEVDAMPGGHVCSGTLKGFPKAAVRETAHGGGPLRKLFSKEQRAFYAEHAPEGIGIDDLSLLGPIFVLKLKGSPAGYERRLVGELWLFPDQSRILELSTKCAPGEAFQVAAETRAYLASLGIEAGEGQTKTRKSLQYFSKQLDRPAAQR